MKPITIFYDNFCPNCTNFVNNIKKFDWLKLIIVRQLRNPKHTDKYKAIDIKLAKRKMATYINHKWFYGFESIYLILCKIPLLWLFIPILYVLKITKIGELFYKKIAFKRKIIPSFCDNSNCLNNGK